MMIRGKRTPGQGKPDTRQKPALRGIQGVKASGWKKNKERPFPVKSFEEKPVRWKKTRNVTVAKSPADESSNGTDNSEWKNDN